MLKVFFFRSISGNQQANIRILGKSLAKQSISIIPKIRELDEFLEDHPEYRNRILESHPELAFARLRGRVVRTRKKEFTGFMERVNILDRYLPGKSLTGLLENSKEYGCKPDDLLDAVCLAVTAALSGGKLTALAPYRTAVGVGNREVQISV